MTEHNPINEQSKQQDLGSSRQAAGEYLTTNEGVRVRNTNDSLKAGERGPTLIEDFHFREKLQHFDRERIPEQVVHARGMKHKMQAEKTQTSIAVIYGRRSKWVTIPNLN